MLPISDVTMEALEYALDGLNLRSEVIADNIANAETPGYRAATVDFEQQLQSAMRSGRYPSSPVVTDAGGAPDASGNTVAVEREIVEMLKTNLLRDAVINAYNFKVDVLRSAITGGGI